jgi:hypothetical protein
MNGAPMWIVGRDINPDNTPHSSAVPSASMTVPSDFVIRTFMASLRS